MNFFLDKYEYTVIYCAFGPHYTGKGNTPVDPKLWEVNLYSLPDGQVAIKGDDKPWVFRDVDTFFKETGAAAYSRYGLTKEDTLKGVVSMLEEQVAELQGKLDVAKKYLEEKKWETEQF